MNPLLPFEWVLATRFLREGLLQTLFIIAGVALGVSVIVFMSALLTGLQASIFGTLLDFQPQIVISAPDEAARSLRESERESQSVEFATLVQPRTQRPRSLDQWQKVRSTTLAIPGVLVVAPVAEGAAFILRGDANTGVAVRGIEPESYLRLIRGASHRTKPARIAGGCHQSAAQGSSAVRGRSAGAANRRAAQHQS